MTRAQFAEAIGVPEKWVHNAAATLGRRLPYTIPSARRLAVARIIQTGMSLPLPVAYRLAPVVLAEAAGVGSLVSAHSSDAAVSLTVDLAHVLSAFAVRLARALQSTPRRAGRRRTIGRGTGPADARARAKAYGVDLSLIDANLRRTPDERLRAHEANAAFVTALRRRAPGRSHSSTVGS